MHLIDKLKEKDENALKELMNQYGDYLLRTAFLLVKDHQTAEETVQDTFITAFDRIEQLKDPAKLKSWLTTITINKCRSRMRKWNWKNIFLLFETSENTTGYESIEGPEQQLLDKIDSESLSGAIQKLDYIYREVITLFYFSEMKISEIAIQTHTKESTVKSRLKRGRVTLKDILQKGEGYDDGREKTTEKATER